MKIKKYDSVNGWVQQYPEVNVGAIVVSTDIDDLTGSTDEYFLRADGSWAKIEDSGNQFVNITGDTMTGDLTLSKNNANTSLTIDSGTASSIINMNGTGTSFIEKDTGNDLYIAHNVSDKNIHFRVNDGGTQTVLMTLNGSSSRVGIGTGTSNPSEKLEVGGDVLISGSGGTIGSTGSIDNAFLKIGTGLGLDPNQIFFTSTAYINSSGPLGLGGGGNGVTNDIYINSSHNVGIGTTSPTRKLDVAGDLAITSAFPRIYLVDTDHNNDYSILNGNGYFGVYDDTAGAYRFRINSSGNAIIGDANPSNLGFLEKSLEIQAGSSSDTSLKQAGLVISGSSDADDADDFAYLSFRNNHSAMSNDRVAEIRVMKNGTNVDTADMHFYTANGTSLGAKLSILNSGNVGIGTTSPQATLDVKDSLRISRTATYTSHWKQFISHTGTSNYGTLYFDSNSSTGDFVVRPNLSEKFRIKASGNVGIGTTDPDSKLTIVQGGNGSSNSLIVKDDARQVMIGRDSVKAEDLNGNAATLYLNQPGGNTIISAQQGSVGIGISSPAEKLDVNGSVQANGNFKFKGSGGYYIYNSSGTFRGGIIDDGGATKIYGDGNGSTPIITLDGGNIKTGGNLIFDDDVNNSDYLIDFQEHPDGTYGAYIRYDGSSSNALEIGTRNAGTETESIFIDRNTADVTFRQDVTIQGDLTINGNYTQVNTVENTTEQWSVTNDGTGPAVIINQKGSQPVIDIQDDGTSVFYIEDGGNLGIKTTNPTTDFEVSGRILSTTFSARTNSSRDKYRLYDTSNQYTIGMQSGVSYGGLNDWAMTFQFNNENDRGFWWGDTSHSTSQGSMALTTNGLLTVANRIRVGYGESDTTTPSSTQGALDVYGNVNISGVIPTLKLQSSNNNDEGEIHFTNQATQNARIRHEVADSQLKEAGQGLIFEDLSGTTFHTEVNGNTYAKRFYDYDNTSYYVDPASTSVLNFLNVQKLEVEGAIFNVETDSLVMPMVKGGHYEEDGTVTGAIEIVLPSGTYANATMLNFFVDVYDYNGGSDGESFTLHIGGYIYTNGTWYNTFANLVSGRTDRFFNVRFNNDSSNNYNIIYIGETTSSWDYPKVTIRDFSAGFSGADDADWYNNSFSIDISTTILGTTNHNKSAENVSSYALNADKLDNVEATSFLRSDATDTATGQLYLTNHTNHYNGHHYFDAYDANGNHYPHYLNGSNNNGAQVNMRVYNSSGQPSVFFIDGDSDDMTWRGNKIWTAGNDGTGSGLSADNLRGYLPQESASANSIAKRDGNGDLKVNKLIDGGNTSYFIDPASTSIVNAIQAGLSTGDYHTRLETNALEFDRDGTSYINQVGTGNIAFRFGSSYATRMTLTNSGGVGIGTTSITSGYKLEVNGKVKASNGKLASVEYTNSGTTTEVDTINFDLNGSTLTITTS